MASIAEAVAQNKDALADYLATTEGLRDTVTVSSAALDKLPEANMVILGDVTTPQSKPGLATREGKPTMEGWVIVHRAEGGEETIRETRRVAAQYMRLVEAAVSAINGDPAAAGLAALPGSVLVASSGSQESPADWNGQAARQATIPFSITWTTHTI
jgi:hypothetical protein